MVDEPDKVDVRTPDLAAEKLAALQELFPGVVADGVLDAGQLGELVGLDVAGLKEGKERYGLMWAGRHEAVQSLLRPSRGTLTPDIENSVNFDTAENVFIEGDNLEVLKLLQKAYNDQVKLIYIDPPYNTGNDFVYNDDFSDGLRGYLEYTGQLDEDGNRSAANTETAGRLHSRWLSMMYPRLVLARNLLRQDGALCVSIDSNEDYNLRDLLNEVFGEENFVGQMVVIRAEGGGMAEQLVQGHDLLLVYARNRKAFPPLRRPKDFRGRIVAVDGVEYWIEEDWLRKEFGKYGTCHYEEILEFKGQATLDEVDAKLASGEYRLLPKKNGMNIVGRLRRTDEDASKFYSVIKHLSKEGKARLKELDLEGAFDFPKPVSLVKSLVLGATYFSRNNADLILDYFAGSGTTADAVLQLNAEDGGNRRCLSINLPEPTAEGSAARKMGFDLVSDVTRARIKAAMTGVSEGDDLGLAVYSLGNGNFVEGSVTDIDGQLELETRTGRFDRFDRHSIAAEVMLKEGVPLHEVWAWDGADVASAGGVSVVLTRDITDLVVKAAMNLSSRVLVFLEDGFEDNDSVKANAYYACQQAGITMKTV